jgi:hypothetical protein
MAEISRLAQSFSKRRRGLARRSILFLVTFFCFTLPACETTTTTVPLGPNLSTGQKKEQPRGFFDKLSDQMTERECSVARFSCPFGFGPANEPCDCTDPEGRVLQGRTIK